MIAKADKGNTTVVLDKSDYLFKVEDHMNDVDIYVTIVRDPCNKLQNWLIQNYLNYKEAVKLRSSNITKLLCSTS